MRVAAAPPRPGMLTGALEEVGRESWRMRREVLGEEPKEEGPQLELRLPQVLEVVDRVLSMLWGVGVGGMRDGEVEARCGYHG